MLQFRYKMLKKPPINVFFVKRNWSRINRTPIQQAGIRVRRKELDLIRRDTTKSQKPSKPSKPPKSRHPLQHFRGGAHFGIKSIPFRQDTAVVIGHKPFRSGGKTAMELHEFGKSIQIRTIRPRTKARTKQQAAAARKLFLAGRLKAPPPVFVTKTIRMPKRPFAAPALAKTLPKLPELWRNSISSATVRN